MNGRRAIWGVAAVPLIAIGACRPSTDDGNAIGADFALQSAAIALPADAEAAVDDVLTVQCGACHSAGMLTTQPALKPEQWAATVKKMREAYKAPIADADVPAVLAALTAMQASSAGDAVKDRQ